MERTLNVAELILIAGTRVALGVGIGLLLGNRLTGGERKAAGLSLALIGGLTTVPLIMLVGRKSSDQKSRLAA